MTNEKLLEKLPPEIAAKFREEEAKDDHKQAVVAWTEINQNALDALLTVATTAWAMAATPEEREMVVQHTAFTMTFVRQLVGAAEMLLLPNQKTALYKGVTAGMQHEIGSHDAWLRENFPGGAAARAEALKTIQAPGPTS